MSKQHTPTDPGPHAAETQVYRQALHELINMGADLARQLHVQAIAQAAQRAKAKPIRLVTDAPPAPSPGPDALIKAVASFDRITSAVCQSIALAKSLDAPQQPAKPSTQHRIAARKHILRAVGDAIQRPADNPDCDPPEALLPELHEHMDAPDLDDDIRSRPVAEIIAEICRDLSLAALPGTRPWKRRTPADIAELVARAAGQPSAGPQDGRPAAASRAQPSPFHPAGGNIPEDPARMVATVVSHPTRLSGRRRTPPEG